MGSSHDFQTRHAKLKALDDDRERLVEDLIAKVEELEKKCAAAQAKLRYSNDLVTLYDSRHKQAKAELAKHSNLTKSNLFVVALIDGDSIPFCNEFLRSGEDGGGRAACLLESAIKAHVRHINPDLHNFEVIVRVYGNLKHLAIEYVGNKIIKYAPQFYAFVHGFNAQHALFDFVDVGGSRGCADEKLRACLKLYNADAQCKHIIFGGSEDNGYARHLGPYGYLRSLNDSMSKRISILDGPWFSMEPFIADMFTVTSFPDVFKSGPGLSNQALATITNMSSSVRLSTESGSEISRPSSRPSRVQGVLFRRPKTQALENVVIKNSKGERIDTIIQVSEPLIAAQKKLKACNTYQLTGICQYEVLGELECHFTHEKLSERQLEAQRYIARFTPCETGLACEDPLCLAGHACTKPKCPGFGCRYPPEMHNVSRD